MHEYVAFSRAVLARNFARHSAIEEVEEEERRRCEGKAKGMR